MRSFVAVVLGVVVVLVMAAPASAAAVPGRDALVVLSGDAVVAEGESVESVVVFDGAVTVDGTVDEVVVAFSGPVTITGDVGETVVVFDGELTVADGAHIGGDVYADQRTIAPGATIGGDVRSMSRLGIELGWTSALAFVAFWLAASLSLLVLGLLLIWIAPRAADATAVAGKEAVGPSIGWGFAVFIGLPILAVVAIATLVGLPLGLGLLFALAMIFAVGTATGEWILGRLIIRSGSRVGAFALGWAIVSAASLIPGVGGVLWFAATIYGLGVICVAMYRARRGPSEPAAIPPVPTAA